MFSHRPSCINNITIIITHLWVDIISVTSKPRFFVIYTTFFTSSSKDIIPKFTFIQVVEMSTIGILTLGITQLLFKRFQIESSLFL